MLGVKYEMKYMLFSSKQQRCAWNTPLKWNCCGIWDFKRSKLNVSNVSYITNKTRGHAFLIIMPCLIYWYLRHNVNLSKLFLVSLCARPKETLVTCFVASYLLLCAVQCQSCGGKHCTTQLWPSLWEQVASDTMRTVCCIFPGSLWQQQLGKYKTAAHRIHKHTINN